MNYFRDIECSVHQRIYYFKKNQFILLSIAFLLIVFISLLVGSFGPSVLSRVTIYGSELLGGYQDFTQRTFTITTKPFIYPQRELWLSVVFHRHASQAEVTLPLVVEVKIKGTPMEGHNNQASSVNRTQSQWIGTYSKITQLTCTNLRCPEILVAHLVVLAFDVYTFHVSFLDNEPSSEKWALFSPLPISKLSAINFANVEFILQTYSSSFAYFEFISRFMGVIIVLSMIVVFIMMMRKFKFRDWSLEQRWLAILLPFLLLYFNPLYPLIILTNNWLPRLLDHLFQLNYFSLLLLFWLTMSHGIRINYRRFNFYFPKILVVFSFWLLVCWFLLWKEVYINSDIFFELHWKNVSLLALFIALGIVASIYLLYFFIMLVRTCSELSSHPYFSIRLQFFSIPSLIVMMSALVVGILRFNHRLLFSSNAHSVTTRSEYLESFRASKGIQPPFYTASIMVMSLFRSTVEPSFIAGLMIAYFFVMLIGYSPSHNALKENNFKYSPLVSLDNGSDEDILYKSENEELLLKSLQFR